MDNIEKLNETTFVEVTPKIVEEVRVTRTLDDVLADIAGREAARDRALQEAEDHNALLEELYEKRDYLIGIGIKSATEVQDQQIVNDSE